jgi:hypothetical protein
MKRGDLVRVRVPLDSLHPGSEHLNGMMVLILGERTDTRTRPGVYYVRGLGDRVRMFPVRWLEVVP